MVKLIVIFMISAGNVGMVESKIITTEQCREALQLAIKKKGVLAAGCIKPGNILRAPSVAL